ncbi:hypothetical protein C7974DRAFT_380810 [Boeremia exigua]|uniref:uncharacterized protein n=1 Tax=Boeremia exigua TaxID=749465 RepID=UPI001E8E0232|nr:uncharacterized protein C7974DRAFT_380810 [Boeremia exigua]KAH6613098.1 hypothetical protein C7974DRAFT_380810 [Boeremia exigua]
MSSSGFAAPFAYAAAHSASFERDAHRRSSSNMIYLGCASKVSAGSRAKREMLELNRAVAHAVGCWCVPEPHFRVAQRLGACADPSRTMTSPATSATCAKFAISATSASSASAARDSNATIDAAGDDVNTQGGGND